MLDLSKAYTPKQIEILRACRNTDWFMLINHGAKRSGKTQLDNDLFIQELIRVRKTADQLGIDTPQYILAGYSLGNIQDNILTELSNKYGFEFKFDKFNNFTLADQLGIDTPQYILAGYSLGNIQDNILTELSNKYGFEFKFDKFNNFTLFGVKVVQTSHGSISGLGRIRGMTAFGSIRHSIFLQDIL